ncbi:steroid 17-alpha-hydroxylase/17,20 lyase-like [Saccostrea echinata]|uniref:steroid 17-alpha-hydroxylase/17,20 lyase-like n=1 Tax=Saccostrea echinata TaxID=191078 RepID=UPI002A83C0B6|nr:steroid 17-alpha-hydroxylase/17,20 lyase-like [Saccostrea echinata]
MLLEFFTTCCFVSIVSFVTLVFWPLLTRKKHQVPCIPGRWPIIGNALQLTMDRCHLVFAEWAKRYGTVFEVKLFNEKIVVLNDYNSIHQALVQSGTEFAGRPKMHRTDHKGRCKKSIVWQTYNSKLIFLRKEVHKSLKMYGPGLLSLQDICEPDLIALVDRIQEMDGKLFDPSRVFFDSICNIMLFFLIRQRFEYKGPEIETIREMSKLFNETYGSGDGKRLDIIPWLRFGQNKETRRLEQALNIRDRLWKSLIEQNGTFVEESVVGHLQRLKKDHSDIDNDTIKECFTNLVLAGVDTTATALTCLVLVLLHNQDVQKKMQEEIDLVFPDGAFPSLSGRQQLPLTEAVILELLRFISHVPLAVPHSTTENTKLCGYDIDANSTVYINLWALHHDENIWPNPWKFDPPRFLDDNGRIQSPQHPNRKRLFVFGAGRRVCLGEAFARNRLYLFVIMLLQHFTFEPDISEQLPEADPRSYVLGLVLHPKPFKVRAINRHQMASN